MSASRLASLFQDVYNAADEDDEKQRVRRLWEMAVGSVHLVDRGANKRPLIVKKSEDDDLFDFVLDGDEDLDDWSVGDEPVETEKSAAVDAITDVTERSLRLLKFAHDGELDTIKTAVEVNAIAKALASVSPPPTEEDAVKTETEIDTMKMAIAEIKKPQGCAYCDEPAAYGMVYNGGKEFVPSCGSHVMQATNDLKEKGLKVEEKVAMPSKKKDADKGEKDEKKAAEPDKKKDEEEGKKTDAKKSEAGPNLPSIAARIMGPADDLAIEVAKAGRKISKERLKKFKSALVKLLELAKELDPSEAQDILQASVSKRLESVEGAEVETSKAADDDEPSRIGDGNADDESAATDVNKSEGDEGEVTWGLNLNDPSLHRESVDEDTSFFK
jgi:hypothetical protein